MTIGRTHKGRSWRRVVLVTLVLLIGSAIVNVLVALGCLLVHDSPIPVPHDPQLVLARTHFPPTVDSTPRTTSQINIGWWDGMAFALSGTKDERSGQWTDMHVVKAVGCRCGFPLHAFYGWSLKQGPIYETNYEEYGLRELPSWWPESLDPGVAGHVAPIAPLWPGFAVNTVFYAALLWLPIRGPLVLRRWRRQRRGLCVVCGYDLRGSLPTSSAVCPECGEAAGGLR